MIDSARDTMRLGATSMYYVFMALLGGLNFILLVDVEHSHVRFLGNLVLNLWDCGGYV